MEKNQIFIKTGTKYKKMTRELLEESNLAELIGDKNKMVGIKPNLVSPSDPANGGTTHPEIVAGILEYLKENYGLTYNEDLFYVDYRTTGANLMPDVTIIEKRN